MRRWAVVNAAADPDTLGGQMEDKLPVILFAPERCGHGVIGPTRASDDYTAGNPHIRASEARTLDFQSRLVPRESEQARGDVR